MTDDEINELVAIKMGFEKVKGPFGNPTFGTIHEFGWKLDDKIWQVIPDYCHDIKAAWEIVEYLGPRWSFRLSTWGFMKLSTWEPVQEYEVSFATMKPDPRAYQAMDELAPRAICRAFLAIDQNSASVNIALPSKKAIDGHHN